MIAKELVTNSIIPASPGETFIKALSLMEENRLAHLPVVNGSEYIGLLTEDEIYFENRFEEIIETTPASMIRPYIDESRHVFDVLRIFSEHKLTLLPVLDESNHYQGVITLESLMQRLGGFASFQNPGAVIVLERSYKDYSLSEIAQIIESNDANILSVFISSEPDSALMEISIKINRMELGPILQTFNRYNYVVKASYGEASYYENLKERYNQLMAYLNV